MTCDTRQATSGAKIQNSVEEISQMPFGNFVNTVYGIAGEEYSVNGVYQINDGKDLAITSCQIFETRMGAML